MTNRNATLIDTLHGSLRSLTGIPALLEGRDIYDETGHVDCELMTAILEFMADLADAEIKAMRALQKMLGIEESETTKKSSVSAGAKWTAEEILKHCTLQDNVLKLPAVQFNKKSYAEAKKWIEEAGGGWTGGKVQGFTFPFNAERVFAILKEGKRYNLRQEYQFFETPAEVADWLVMLAGGVHETDTVLEPSAGRGALVKAIHRACPSVTVDCFELMPENMELLRMLPGVNVLGADFTLNRAGRYTKIIANPPFSDNQDIDHVRKMYDLLQEGGTLAAITSPHWELANEQKCEAFRNWLQEVGGRKYEIEQGAFQESGTSIRTLAVVIQKPINDEQ